MSDVRLRVKKVILTSLNLCEPVDDGGLIYNQTKGWDSLGHMSIVGALEEEFGCMLETEEIFGMSNLDIAVETMEKYL